MDFREKLKKYREKQNSATPKTSTSTTPTSSSKTEADESSTGSTFRDKLNAYRDKESTNSFEGWAKSSISLIENIYNRNQQWFDKTEYESQSNRASDLLAKADSWRKQYANNKEAVDYINSVVKALSQAKSNSYGAYKIYSNYKSQEEFDETKHRTAVDNAEGRKQRYESNKKSIDELIEYGNEYKRIENQYNAIQNGLTTDFKPENIPYKEGTREYWEEYRKQESAYNQEIIRQYKANKSKYASWQDIKAEIDAYKVDNAQYERGEGGYVSKIVDDYSWIKENEDFAVDSQKRDYVNSSEEDIRNADLMSDSSTWYYDANGVYRDVYDNELAIDENGKWYSPKAREIQVEDKLGLYLGLPKEQRKHVEVVQGSNGVWDSIMTEGDGGWEYLTEGEIGIYYYLLDESQEKAYQYLDDMETELNRRKTLADTKRWQEGYDEASVLEKIGLNLATVPAQLTGSVLGFLDDTSATLRGEEINPYSGAHSGMHYSQTIRGATAEDLDDLTGNYKVPLIDMGLSDIYQVGMSRLDSALATATMGAAGTFVLGAGSATNEAYRLYKQGATAEQITLGALASGTAEALFEYVSFDKIVNMEKTGKLLGWVKNTLIQGGVEASEELATEVSNIISNAVIMGSQSDVQQMLDANGGDWTKTGLQLVQQSIQAAIGGFIGGISAGGVEAGKVAKQVNAEHRQDGKVIMGAEGGVDALKNLANEVAGVSDPKMQKSIEKQSKNVASDKATGNNLVGKAVAAVKNNANATKVGRLHDTVQTANNLNNASANKTDIAKSLLRKGFNSETAMDIAEALVASYNGQELTKAQSKLLESAMESKVVQDAISNIVMNKQSTMGQRSQNIRDFQNDIKLGTISSTFGISKDALKEMAKGNLPAEEKKVADGSYEVSVDGKMVNTKTGDVIEPVGLVQAGDGTYLIATKDGTVATDDVKYADHNQAIVFETFVNLAKHSGKISKVFADMDLGSRNKLLSLYNPTINPDGGAFVNGVLDTFFYGHRGVDLSAASKNSAIMALTEEQRQAAWEAGRTVGEQVTADVQSHIDTVYEEAKNILEKSGKEKSQSYHAILTEGITPMSLNENESLKAAYKLADYVAQAAQVNVYVYASETGEHGFYNHDTDEIWLNLKAANRSKKSMMAFTLAHELVHRAKKGSLAKYEAFTEFLIKEYGKQGSNLEEMIAEQIEAAERFNKNLPEGSKKVEMTREKALEEVVCDACQRMLLDTNAGQKLAEFGAKSKENRGFLEELKRWITEFMDMLRSLFVDVEPDSLAAKEFGKFDANVKQILADMFVDMTTESGEKLSTIKAAYGGKFAEQFFGVKDIRYNLAAVDSHKAKLQKEYSDESSTDLGTIMARYDKIIGIWNKLGGELNSKFLEDWNSKVGKDRSFTIFKAQAGYKYNVELSSMCKKGVPLFEAIDTIVKQEVMKELGTDILGKAEKEILYDILKQHHFEIPCAICYVEQARQREGVIIDAFLNGKVEKNAKGETTKVKLGWNQVLDSIEKEMKANGVSHSFAQVSRDIATEKYTPANLDMDMKTQAAFYAALKKIANQEIARYNKAEGKKRKLLNEVTPAAVKECFKGTLPANLKIFKVLFEEPSSRFKIQNDLLYSSVATQNLSMAHNKLYGLFNSQGGVSGYKTKQGTTIYWGDILGKSWKPDTLRNEGGVRNQSNSDFQMYTLLDQAQMYMDFTAKGYYLQAYTKVLSELKLFGLSRGKINASLIPKVVVYRNADGDVDVEKTMATAGLDENGNPIYDDIEGINHDEAFMLIEDPEYSKSICGICIGYSDAHINKLLDDSRVQQIIGFHDKTDDGTKRYKGARYAKNYNGLNEAVNKEGKTVHIGFNPYVKRAEKKFKFNAETETYEGTVNYNGKTYTADDIPRLAADLYLEMCVKKEYTPAYDAFKNHPNYYKLLADFGLYDSQGHYAPHRKVAYNMPDTVPYLDANGKKQTMKTADYIKAELEKELAVRDSIAEALADTSSEGIIPQFKAAVKKSQAEKSFSLPKVDSDGNQLSAEQQEFFKESKVRDANGNLMVMYHGTANGGAFTVFDGDKLGNDTRTTQVGQGFYFTNMRKEAESYTKNVDIYGKVSRGTNPHLHQVYLNITNPFNIATDKLDMEKVKSVYADGTYDYFFDSWIPFYLDKKTVNGRMFTKAEIQAMNKYEKVSAYVDYLSGLGTKEVLSNMVRAFPYGKQSELLASMKNRLGYDGIVEEFKPGQFQYVAFSSEQVKNVDNQKPTTNPDIRYSLPKTQNEPYRKPAYEEWQVETALVDALDHADKGDDNLILVGEMPRYITDKLGIEGDFFIYRNHAYENMVSRDKAIEDGRPITRKGEAIHFHDLGIEKMTDAVMALENPIMAIATKTSEGNPAVVMLLPVKGKNNAPLYAVLSFYSNKPINGDLSKKPHIVLTIAERDFFGSNGRSGYAEIVGDAVKDGRVIDFNKEMRDDLSVIANPAGVGNITESSLATNLSRFLKEIKSFREKNNIDYKLPVGEDNSPRALLANAFEGIITNDIEKRKIQEYKGKVGMLNAEEEKLRKLRAQIKELSFAKGKRDTKKIKELQFDANQTANRIATLDKMLLGLEASAPLQNILKREKEMAYKRAEQKGKEALEAYKKAEQERDQKWQSEVKEKYQASKKKAIETREKREAREKLQKLVLDTVKWISYPTKTDVKCPDILKQPYADFLNGIDLSSKRLANGGDPTKNDLRLANAMGSLATALEKIMTSQDPTQDTDKVLDTGYLDLPANFVQKLRDMTENIKAMMVEGDYVVNNMSATEVRQLSQMIRTLNHAIKEVSTLYANLRFANVETLGDDTMSFMDALGEIEKTGGVKDFVQWDNALPYYAFKRFGTGGESIFEGLMDAQDKLAFLAQEIFKFRENAWTDNEAKAWSEDTHTIDLPNGNTLTLTTADAMSIYCLSRREQGLQHLLGGGARVMGIQEGSKKAKDSRSILTIKDIDAINSSLTDRQRAVAEAIQEFMSTVCSEWGNEISMKRFLTKEFTEKFYFPIESNDENLPTKDPAAQQSDLFRLLNISATKPLTPGANNEVIIRNIFDVFTGHASDMARLNAYGMALLDYMKWLNYREKTVNEEGQIKVRGVRKSMEKAYGNAAKSYVLNLVKDVNGRPSDGGDPNILMKWMRAAKTASVGSSLRVATLQITSYPRASLVLSPKSLVLGLHKLPQIEKAKKYCGIALWKSFGFYDTNISRSIEDQMKGVTDVKQKLIELSLKGAEWGDAITWGCLWNACEYEVAKTTKNKVGSEEFYQEVGKKLREVVYRTQVVDSTLTRSQMMRSKRGMAQEAAAFMSEPTLSANILMDAGFQFNAEKRRTGSAKTAWKNAGAYIGRTVAVYSVGQLAAALLEGLWDAWRDDEDEEFWKKYLKAFGENLALDIVPFNKIPIVSDVFEAALAMFDVGFYSSDKMSTTWLTQAVSAVDAWKDVIGGKSSTTAYNAIYKSVRAISSFYGVSFSGVMREGVALWNNTAGAYDSTLKIRQYELSKSDLGNELYEAIISGDTRQADSLKAQFEDDNAMSSAVRKALRENDPRIREAAIAWNANDLDEYMRIAKEIIAEGHFSQDNVVRAIRSEAAALSSDSGTTGTSKEKGMFTTEKFAEAVAQGDHTTASAAKDDIIQTAVKNGKTEDEAEKSFISSAKTELKEQFVSGGISKEQAIYALKTYCQDEDDPMDDNDIYWLIKKWEYEKDTGSSDGYGKYNDFHTAVKTGKNLKAVIKEYTDHGVDEKTLASQITSYFKPLYKEMSNYERASIKGYLLNAYVMLGYNRAEKSKDIDKWLKD